MAEVLEADAAVEAAAEAVTNAVTETAAETATEAPSAPIIVKKIVGGHGGAHGGAWKIALADMMTAMMAFFLLMWLLGASEEDKRKSVADYFRPSTSHSIVEMGKSAGSGGLLGGKSIIDPEAFPGPPKQTAMLERVTPQSEGGPGERESSDQGSGGRSEGTGDADFDQLERELKDKLAQNKRFAGLQDQVQFSREADGLRIDILDKADFSMFGLGTSKLLPRSEALVAEVAATVAKTDRRLAVRGHTDNLPFGTGDSRSNFSLSAERAESTRAALERRNIPAQRFARIEGVADTQPYNSRDPADPRNRRISITVLNP